MKEKSADWGHAIVAIGYDDAKKIRNTNNNKETTGTLLIRNSWGKEWGDKGSPGLAKIAPYLPCHRDNFSAKVPGLVAGWLRQVTLTCPYPLAVICKQQPDYKH